MGAHVRWEVVDGHDTTLARLCGEVGKLREASALGLEADEAEARVSLSGIQRVGGGGTDGHTEALVYLLASLVLAYLWTAPTHGLECSDLLVSVGVEVLLGVVDGHATVDAVGQSSVLHDRDPLVGAVLVLEKHDGSPVVGEVLGEGTCCAGTPLANIALHRSVEGIATNNLVKMLGSNNTRLNQRVEALDGEGRASKAKGSLRRRGERESEGKILHLAGQK